MLDDSTRRGADGSKFNVVLEEVLFKFGQNVLAVSVLPECRNMRPNFVHEQFALGRLGHVNHFLYNVISILQDKKCQQLTHTY